MIGSGGWDCSGPMARKFTESGTLIALFGKAKVVLCPWYPVDNRKSRTKSFLEKILGSQDLGS